MASNVTVTIAGDASQLRAELAVAQSALRAASREMASAANVARKTQDDLSFARVGQAAGNFEQVNARVAELKRGMEQAAQTGQVLNKSFALNRGGLLELQAAGVNSFQALASGMDVFRVATMEGAQVIGGLVQGGVIGFSALLSPLGLISGAALAAAGGIGYLAYQAYQTRQVLGGMQAELLLTGRTGASSIDEAGKAAEALAKKFDLSKRAAADLLAEVAKARTLNAEQIRQVAELAAAEGKARRAAGDDVTDADIAKKMTAALADGAAGAIKLAQSYNIATAAAEQMLKSGNELGAFRKIMDDLAAHIRSHGGAWSEAKAKAQEYQRELNQIVGAMGELGAAGIAEAERVAGARPAKPTELPSGGSGIAPGPTAGFATIPGAPGADRMRAWLLANGYTPQAAAGIMGNASVESGFNPAARNASGHFGLFQWDKERQAPLGGSTDFDRQMELMDRELTKIDPTFKTATASAQVLAGKFESIFERSGGQLLNERLDAAQKFAGSGAGGGAETEFADKAARERQQRDVEQGYRLAEIANRNSLEKQIAEAQEHYNKLADLVRGENPKITDAELAKDARIEAAQIDLTQKKAQLYDQDTGRAIAALREQQAAATEIKDKIRLQGQVIGTLQARGAPVTQIDSARTELAGLQRQASQDAVSIEEEKLGRLRSMGQLELQADTAREQLRVAQRTQSQDQAVAHEAAATDKLLGEQRRAAQSLVDLAESLGLSARQVEKFKDGVKQIDLDRATKAAQFQTKQVEAQNALIEKWVAPVKQAFDQIGSSIEGAISGILTRQKTWAGALKEIQNSVISSVVSGAGGVLSKLGAKSIFGATQGEGIGEAAFNSLAKQLNLGDLLGIGTKATGEAAGAAAITGAGAAFSAEVTAAGAAFAASVTAAGAASGASSAAGGLASGGGGIFSFLSGAGALAALSRGGIVPSAAGGMIVPSAAGGWSLPSKFGSDSVLSALTPREMVLPVGERPSSIADRLSAQIAGMGASGGPTNIFNIHALDHRSVAQLIASHGDAIATGLSRARRNFNGAGR